MLVNIRVEIMIDKYNYVRSLWEEIENMNESELEELVKGAAISLIYDMCLSRILAEIKKKQK